MNNLEKFNTMVQISKLYYEHNLGQQAIANRLKISRSYVSKLLIEAKAQGIVEIKIKDPIEIENKIERAIREKFGLKKVIVVPVNANEYDKKLDAVGVTLAKYLYNIVNDGDIIGVSWGVTLSACSKKLVKKDLKDVIFTQLYGGLTHIQRGMHTSEIVINFAKAFNATPYFMLVPAIVDNEEMRNNIIKDSSVANVLALALKSQIALFSVAEFGPESSLVRAGYFKMNEMEELIRRGVVGDACARLFNVQGEIVESEFDHRTVGIPLDNLRQKNYSVLIVADERKVNGIYGILRGGYANVLIIDEITAKALLDRCEEC